MILFSQTLDPYIEEQLIDQVIDVMYRDYPEMVQDKKVRRHLIQMLVGKVMAGEVRDIIDVDRFIKRLKNNAVGGYQIHDLFQNFKKSNFFLIFSKITRFYF